jgi:hypothetical protein
MSKISLEGNALGSGTLTIAAPNTNSNFTLSLPTNTGTILTNATTAGFPAGSVLQVVSATSSTEVTINSGSFTDTGLSVSITPASASNKILVLASSIVDVRSSGTQTGVAIRLVRDSTSLFSDTADGSLFINAATASSFTIIKSRIPVVYLDSPNTTSSITYKIQGNNGGGDTASFQRDSSPSFITLMEIAA